MPTSCLPRGVPSLATGFAPAGFGLLGPFLQRHGKPSSRARRSYSARTARLHRSSIARSATAAHCESLTLTPKD